MEFKEIYCFNCKKVLGRYNDRYYSEQRMGEIIKANHSTHVYEGHEVRVRRVTV